tara:strand:- start:359 stop:487 length:129 start_codon:yes stop_codon:yes gene_type:complete
MFASIQKAPTDDLNMHDFVKLMCTAAAAGTLLALQPHVQGAL